MEGKNINYQDHQHMHGQCSMHDTNTYHENEERIPRFCTSEVRCDVSRKGNEIKDTLPPPESVTCPHHESFANHT